MPDFSFKSWKENLVLTVTGIPEGVHPNSVRAVLRRSRYWLRGSGWHLVPTPLGEGDETSPLLERISVPWAELQTPALEYVAINVRLSWEERELLQQAARKSNRSLQQWCREILIEAALGDQRSNTSSSSSSSSARM
jgi:hypothetical protein